MQKTRLRSEAIHPERSLNAVIMRMSRTRTENRPRLAGIPVFFVGIPPGSAKFRWVSQPYRGLGTRVPTGANNSQYHHSALLSRRNSAGSHRCDPTSRNLMQSPPVEPFNRESERERDDEQRIGCRGEGQLPTGCLRRPFCRSGGAGGTGLRHAARPRRRSRRRRRHS
ncbi:hypothetical protein [Azospirillum endophyticum]